MIQINDLSFYYKKGIPIFNNVSFRMKSGIYGLLGENGVGKSTLLHIISGLQFPKSGSCEVLGDDSYRRLPRMYSDLFFLPEEFEMPGIKVKDYVRTTGRFYRNFDFKKFDECIGEFQIDREQKFTEMSYGQKKKTMISFGLSTNASILLLDEPTNGLDIPSKTKFRQMIASASDEKKCIIISTHQVRDLESLIDPIIILDRNQVILNNSVGEISQKLYFGTAEVLPENVLYYEQRINGFAFVALNSTGKESTMNLEFLFNAAVHNKAVFKQLFNL